MTTERLTQYQLDTLYLLGLGPCTLSVRTAHDPDPTRLIRSAHSGTAGVLVKRGLARYLPHWDAVEITEEGRAFLARRLPREAVDRDAMTATNDERATT